MTDQQTSAVELTAVPVSFETIQAADGSNELSKFTMHAYTGGRMRVGWYGDAVVDLDGLEHDASMPILRDHNPGKVVGHATSISIDSDGLRVAGVVSGAGTDAREVVSSSRNGYPWQASIGADVNRYEDVEAGTTVTVNGREFAGPVTVIREASLREVSFVAVGADRNTSALAANAHTNAPRKAAPMTDTATTDQADTQTQSDQANTQAATDVVNASGLDASADDFAAIRAERDRRNAIRAASRQTLSELPELVDDVERLEQLAISAGQSADQYRLELARETRRYPNVGTGRGDQGPSMRTLEAAILKTAMHPEQDLVASYGERTMDAVDKHFGYGTGLQDAIMHAARANGFSGTTFRVNPREAFQAAFSSNELSGVLANVTNKILLDSFMAVEQSWRMIAGIRSVPDFKQSSAIRLTAGMEFQKVSPTGELKHGTLADETYNNQAETRGLMIGIGRNQLFNDDLGALTQVPAILGRNAGIALNKEFWSKLLGNTLGGSAFFSAGNNNYQDGSDTALGIDALTAAETLFDNQTDSGGNPISVPAAYLVVPTALHARAMQIYKSTEVRYSYASGDAVDPIANPHGGKFEPVKSVWLSNSQLSGNSTTGWYLFARPRDLAAIEVVFLNGRQTPFVEQADADFGSLGINMRSYYDFGVELQDHRGAVFSKGTS